MQVDWTVLGHSKSAKSKAVRTGDGDDGDLVQDGSLLRTSQSQCHGESTDEFISPWTRQCATLKLSMQHIAAPPTDTKRSCTAKPRSLNGPLFSLSMRSCFSAWENQRKKRFTLGLYKLYTIIIRLVFLIFCLSFNVLPERLCELVWGRDDALVLRHGGGWFEFHVIWCSAGGFGVQNRVLRSFAVLRLRLSRQAATAPDCYLA